MPASRSEDMHPVSVKMTAEMIDELGRIEPDIANRSEVVRILMSGILSARRDGELQPFEMALSAGLRSSARTQKLTQAPKIAWQKVIIWIPLRMHGEIQRIVRDHDLRPADLIRGALIGFTECDPARDVLSEGYELWTSELETDKRED